MAEARAQGCLKPRFRRGDGLRFPSLRGTCWLTNRHGQRNGGKGIRGQANNYQQSGPEALRWAPIWRSCASIPLPEVLPGSGCLRSDSSLGRFFQSARCCPACATRRPNRAPSVIPATVVPQLPNSPTRPAFALENRILLRMIAPWASWNNTSPSSSWC